MLPGIVILYYEIIFQIFTGSSLGEPGTAGLVLFSLAYGGILALLLTVSRRQRVNSLLAGFAYGILALPYLVEYFVYRQFKIYYDLNTVMGGAADVAGSYRTDIFLMVFTWSGILTILLYLLPAVLHTVLHAVVLRKKGFPAGLSRKERLMTAGAAAVTYGLALGLVLSSPVCKSIYTREYNFQTAVNQFGLLTALRLDGTRILFGKDGSFEGEERDQGESRKKRVPREPQGFFDYNKMDLGLEERVKISTGTEKELYQYIAAQEASRKNAYTGLFAGKNLIMICAEAFSEEVLDPDLTPALYRLAAQGIQFTDYYQPAGAGTTGGEYQYLFGMLPSDGGMSFKNMEGYLEHFTLGSQLDRQGYYGQTFHNNDYQYYDRHKTHADLGYSEGFMGCGNGMEKKIENNLAPRSDAEMIEETLPLYLGEESFNIYYMTVSGHGPYDTKINDMAKRHWDKVKHLPYSDTVKAYLACNLELEAAAAHLLRELEKRDLAEDTVICLTTDHFPYGLDADAALGETPYLNELYGQEVADPFQRDHSRLILWSGSLENREPIVVDTPTSSLDILPTLSNLFGLEYDSRLMAGRDVFSGADPLVFNMTYDWKTERGTYLADSGQFTPADDGMENPMENQEDYVEAVKKRVRNKVRYCEGVLDWNLFPHLFPDLAEDSSTP